MVVETGNETGYTQGIHFKLEMGLYHCVFVLY